MTAKLYAGLLGYSVNCDFATHQYTLLRTEMYGKRVNSRETRDVEIASFSSFDEAKFACDLLNDESNYLLTVIPGGYLARCC